MYPNLFYFFKDVFYIELPFLKLINSFGFFVALAFIAGAYILVQELKRKQKLGLLSFKEEEITFGEPASIKDLLTNFIIGFIVGYKLIGVLLIKDALLDTQAFIFSSKGSVGAGLLLGLFLAGMKWWEHNKQKLAKPEKRLIRIWPSDRVGDIVIYAAIFGFLGAKVFDNLENPSRFFANPIESLLSPSGFTFYGGLICATIAIYYYSRKNNIPFIHLCDSAAPALMLSYSVGRIGCQVSGDGDWGIVNLKPNPFSFIPDWMWAYRYPHNVNGEGIALPNCDWGQYCTVLSHPVYPTPFYEVIMALGLFIFLWLIRKKITTPGILFGVYLIVNGIERFFIEKIRVNNTYDIFGFHPTQAEIISTLLVIGGFTWIYFLKNKQKA